MDISGPVEPMLAKLTDRVPVGDGWRFEAKWDGYRCLARRDDDGRVELTSRRGTPLNDAFPEVAEAMVAGIRIGTLLDGELVRWSEGRLDFARLQYRYTNRRRGKLLGARYPCHYIAFDVLETMARGSLLDEPLSARRAELEQLLAEVPQPSLLALGLHTADRELALEWAHTLPEVGVEGLIAKPANSRYVLGQRGPWLKIKTYLTVDVVVGGVTGSLQAPTSVIFGRRSSGTGELLVVGRTTPLSDRAAAELAAALTPAGDEHPWPESIPGGFGQSDPVAYHRVRPELVAEVRVDPATIGQRWRHGSRFLRLRPDRAVDDLPHDLDPQ